MIPKKGSFRRAKAMVIKMTDLHTHILPGVDDGAEDLDEALRMTAMAYEAGTDYLVLTPHCGLPGAPRTNYWGRELYERFRAFRQEVKREGIPIRIGYGTEVFASPELPALLEAGQLLPIAGSRYLLTEFDFDASSEEVSGTLDIIRRAGLVPLLAHPERYRVTQRYPEVVYGWIAHGCVIQMNRGSVVGRFGRSVMECAELLLRANLVHCIASDAHHADFRTPDMNDAAQTVARLCGVPYAELLFEENPLRVVSNRNAVIPRALPLE